MIIEILLSNNQNITDFICFCGFGIPRGCSRLFIYCFCGVRELECCQTERFMSNYRIRQSHAKFCFALQLSIIAIRYHLVAVIYYHSQFKRVVFHYFLHILVQYLCFVYISTNPMVCYLDGI